MLSTSPSGFRCRAGRRAAAAAAHADDRAVLHGRAARCRPAWGAAVRGQRAKTVEQDGRNWTYLPYGPFAAPDAYREWVEVISRADDPLFYAIVDNASDAPVGVASLMRIEPKAGVIEVGGINYSPRLQRRPAATEAMYLLMCRVFDELGYRRYEWKCDSLNAPSRAAAQRLGFTYEGLFRQATVYKERNRDTAWFSILDSEWPRLRTAFEAWLDPANFDAPRVGSGRAFWRACAPKHDRQAFAVIARGAATNQSPSEQPQPVPDRHVRNDRMNAPLLALLAAVHRDRLLRLAYRRAGTADAGGRLRRAARRGSSWC